VPPLLAGRSFRRYWTGQTISLLGDQVSMIALPLTGVLVLRADSAQMGYLMASWLAPNLLFSLPMGGIVDRSTHRRHAMICADLGRALLMASIPITFAAGVLTIAQLYAVAFAVGSLSVLFAVSDSTVFVSLLTARQYLAGNSLLNGSRALAAVSGPGLSGALVQLLSAPAALLSDAASYLASAFFLSRIRPAEPPGQPPARGLMAAGVRFIAHHAVMRAALGATATLNFFNYMFVALFVLYITSELGVAPGPLGAVLSAGAVGGILGSLFTGRLVTRIGIGWAFAAGCVLFPAPLLLVPATGGDRQVVLTSLFLAEFGSGVGTVIIDITAGAIFAAIVPNAVRARVAGAYRSVNFGVRPLGSLTAGALGGVIGLRATLWIAIAGALASTVWLLPSPMLRMRTLPEDGDDRPADPD
jgi:MFS family permease